MAYLLVFDLRGRNSSARQRLSRRLRRGARMVQHSVWEFDGLGELYEAAELVELAGGRAMAFSNRDEILSCLPRVRRLLRLMSNV
ncbi:MAG: hypothetical protein AB1476_06565 [Candidatus Hadarchaeota archaeon]